MRVSAAVAIAVLLPALAAGTLTGILLRPDAPPPPRPRPAIRPAPTTPTPTTTATPPPARPPEKSPADLQKAMLDDPKAFAAALRNDEALFTAFCSGPGLMLLPLDRIPPPVLEVVRDLLKSGSPAQKVAILQLIDHVGWMLREPPIPKEEIVERASGFLTEKDPNLRAVAAAILQHYAPKQADRRFEVVQELMRTSSDSAVRSTCIGVLGQMDWAEARELLLKNGARVASDPEALKDWRLRGATVQSLQGPAVSLAPEEVASICGAALRNTTDPMVFQQWVELGLRLPLPKATTLLEQARDGAPTAEIQAGAKRALEQIRAGETRADRLQTAFRQAK